MEEEEEEEEKGGGGEISEHALFKKQTCRLDGILTTHAAQTSCPTAHISLWTMKNQKGVVGGKKKKKIQLQRAGGGWQHLTVILQKEEEEEKKIDR